MNITEKLGLAADATPEQIADALIKFLAGDASAEDKMALILSIATVGGPSRGQPRRAVGLHLVPNRVEIRVIDHP